MPSFQHVESQDMVALPEIILASTSPRRRDLLARLGLAYRVVPADVDETARPGERPADLALRLAEAKARRVAELVPTAVVIAADTVVARGRTIYGKPADADDAARMLTELVGREHRVVTAVAVAVGQGLLARALASRVRMRPLEPEDIRAYVASGDPLDKAGAYAVQNERFRPVASLSGCRCSVVGFPIGIVAAMLLEAGVAVPVALSDACPYRLFSSARCRPRL